jgi:hypothetical protein
MKKLAAMTDDDIDLSDIPELGEDFFKDAYVRLPGGRTVIPVEVDQDVAAWFMRLDRERAQEEARRAMREYVERQRQTG